MSMPQRSSRGHTEILTVELQVSYIIQMKNPINFSLANWKRLKRTLKVTSKFKTNCQYQGIRGAVMWCSKSINLVISTRLIPSSKYGQLFQYSWANRSGQDILISIWLFQSMKKWVVLVFGCPAATLYAPGPAAKISQDWIKLSLYHQTLHHKCGRDIPENLGRPVTVCF